MPSIYPKELSRPVSADKPNIEGDVPYPKHSSRKNRIWSIWETSGVFVLINNSIIIIINGNKSPEHTL